MAAKNGHFRIVKLLMTCTDNPNASSNNGATPILLAAQNGHFEIVKLLISSTDIISNIPAHDGSTPILMAAKNGHLEIVKMLMNTTDNPNAPNNFGWTPQDIALHENHHEIAELFNP